MEWRGSTITLRRRGLALLYYLALEGPTHRARLAEMLWGRTDAASNLRVELHRTRQVFSHVGLEVFRDREDPLRLPEVIELVRNQTRGEPLVGLDDITTEFQDWLELQRAQLSRSADPGPSAREELVRDLVCSTPQPRVIVLRGAPGDGHEQVALQLADHLGVPLAEGARHSGPVVRYLQQPLPPCHEVIDRIVEDDSGSWVLACSTFGDDPDLVLELLDRLPAEDMRVIELPPLKWVEAYRRWPQIPFAERARIFLAAGSSLRLFEELASLRPPEGSGEQLPMPRRVIAAYRLEMKDLTDSAQLALERLSIQPGVMSEGLVEALEVGADLEELERNGWLAFDQGWSLCNQTARLALYQLLQEGRRRLYHRRAATQAAMEKQPLVEAYHRVAAREALDNGMLLRQMRGWAHQVVAAYFGVEPVEAGERVGTTRIRTGKPLALLECWADGPGLERSANPLEFVIVRHVGDRQPTRICFELPEAPVLLRVGGRAYVDNALGAGISGAAAPLVLEIAGRRSGRVVLAGDRAARALEDGVLLLPLTPEFEHWIAVEDASRLLLSSAAEAAVLEVSIDAYRRSRVTADEVDVHTAFELPNSEILAAQRRS